MRREGGGGGGHAINCFKRRHLSGRMNRGVIAQFGPWKPLLPSSWLTSSKAPKILFENSINHFILAIGLRMVARTHEKICSAQLKKSLPERANENSVSINDNRSGDAM